MPPWIEIRGWGDAPWTDVFAAQPEVLRYPELMQSWAWSPTSASLRQDTEWAPGSPRGSDVGFQSPQRPLQHTALLCEPVSFSPDVMEHSDFQPLPPSVLERLISDLRGMSEQG